MAGICSDDFIKIVRFPSAIYAAQPFKAILFLLERIGWFACPSLGNIIRK